MQRTSPRFRSKEHFVYEISEEMFYPNLQRFVWRRHAAAHPDGHQIFDSSTTFLNPLVRTNPVCVFLFSLPQPTCRRVRLARFARLRLLTYTNPILRKEPTVLQPSAKSAASCESAQFRQENSTHRPRPPGTRSEQFSSAGVTEFSLTSLFLERFWRELTISFRSHKPDIKTKNP